MTGAERREVGMSAGLREELVLADSDAHDEVAASSRQRARLSGGQTSSIL